MPQPHEIPSASSWAHTSAAEIAAAAGVSDLFVFRRVAERRFAHVGGAGRGAGWAGIVEVALENEPFVAAALTSGSVDTRHEASPWRVLGPYYAHAATIVSLSEDVFVIFGESGEGSIEASDSELLELARFASEMLVEVEPAKRLADEIETLNAVRELLQAPAGTFEEALQRLVDHATGALSCDLGVAHVPERELTVISDLRGSLPLEQQDTLAVLEEILQRGEFPVCVQQSTEDELPHPFRSSDGVLAYYLLEITQPLAGVLLLLHTRAGAARGFTLLCQSLGAKLVEAAEPLLAAALLRDTMQDQLERASAQARIEPLTGVGNRLAWEERLASARPSSIAPASVVKVDCRGLKQVNDTRGHHVGDQLLKRVGAILAASSRDEDLVARVGGDEFGVLLLNADEDVARVVVERIRAALAASHQSGHAVIDLSVGFATTYEDIDDADRRADSEMLRAKRARSG